MVGAEVRADSFTAATGEAGTAILRLPEGSYLLSVTRLGFAPWTDSLAVVAGADTSIAITLEERAFEARSLVVSVTRAGRMVKDEPVPVEVLPREEIEENITASPGNLRHLLTEMSGVKVRASAPALAGAGLRIEGLPGRYTQILSDGLPIYGGTQGALELLQVPPLDLARVEVIRGPASAFYGPSALAGVLNLVSRRDAGRPELLLSQSTTGASDASVFAGGALGPALSYTLLASGSRLERGDTNADGWADRVGYRRGVVRPRLFWAGTGGDSLYVTLGLTSERRRGGTMPGAMVASGSPFAVELGSDRLDGGLAGSFRLSDSTSLTVHSSMTQSWLDRVYGREETHVRRGVAAVELAIAGTEGRHDWLAGAAMRESWLHTTDRPDLDYTYGTPSLFVQDLWTPSPALAVAGSARLDRHSRSGTFLSPRLSLLVHPAEDWTLRASAGLGFSPPTPFLERTEETGIGRVRPLSDSVSAERVRSGSLGMSRLEGPIEVNVSLFGAVVDDPLALRVDTGDPPDLEIVNAAESTRTWGAEALVRYVEGPLQLIVSESYLRGTEFDVATGTRRSVSLNPRHEVGVDGIWEDESWGRVGLEFTYVGHQAVEDDPYRTSSPAYLLANFLGEIRIGAERVFVTLENLGNVRQTHWDPFLVPSEDPYGRWTTDEWAPLEGRTLSVGARLEI